MNPAADLNPNDQVFAAEMSAWVTGTLESTLENFADSDWTLIVKLHAMIETALNTVIVAHLCAPELETIISKLDTSNAATGKVAFAKAIKALSKKSGIFVQKLSELRNICVHDIRNFQFDIEKHAESLANDKRTELTKAIEAGIESDVPIVGLREKLFVATITVIAHLKTHQMKCQIRDLELRDRDLRLELLALKAERAGAQTQSTPTE